MFFDRLKFSPKPKKEDHILWTSASYFNQLANLDKDTLNNSLTWDLVSFLHEYVGLKDKKVYPYGQNGIMDAYPVRTSQICLNHEQDLKGKNLEITRAQLETKAALTVETWMEDKKIEVGEKLVIISPRGKISEGYPGLDPENYVFVNIYSKIGENDFQLVQYTSYAREKELQALQNQLINQLDGQIYSPVIEIQQREKIKNSSLSHQIIDKPILLPVEAQFTQLEELIYSDEHDDKKGWVTTREDLPQIDEQLFEEQLQVVLQMLLQQFWILAEQSPNVVIVQFDELINIVRKHFLKWVEEHSSNYQTDSNFAPYSLNLEIILENWQLAVKQKEQRLNHEEEKKLKAIKDKVALNPLQPLMRASSVAHCIVGTPQSLAMQMIKLNPSLLAINSSEFEKISQHEKQDLLEKIRSEEMTEIVLENGQTWMVPANFLPGKGCFVDEYGVAMGPCDIPLEDSFAFMMTQNEFSLFVQQLEQNIFKNELDQTEEMILEKIGKGTTLSIEIKEKINQIKQLIFKPVISIMELFSGDITHTSSGKSKQIRNIIDELKYASDPIKTCENILTKILTEQNGVLSLSNV
ncbi:MAG: hypothetical protein GW941_01215 [Candidatus Pacebacteria bacterium]|nr:hypothetical protein [Candidatus Paceibacterota bacterium]